MPQMIHPDLPGRVIDVDEPKARNRRKAGWIDADNPDLAGDGDQSDAPSVDTATTPTSEEE